MNTATTTTAPKKNPTRRTAKTLSLRKLAEENGLSVESITQRANTPTATTAAELKPEATEATAAPERELTEKQLIARQRRAALRDLSNKLKKLATLAGQDDLSVNELLRQYYAHAGHTELKTFGEWKEAGYYVRKGEKAIILWGHPRSLKKDEATANAEATADTEAQGDFYPLAYLFSNQQVSKRD